MMMHLEYVNPSEYKLTLESQELDTLISAARWVMDGRRGRVPREAREQLESIVECYRDEIRQIQTVNFNERS